MVYAHAMRVGRTLLFILAASLPVSLRATSRILLEGLKCEALAAGLCSNGFGCALEETIARLAPEYDSQRDEGSHIEVSKHDHDPIFGPLHLRIILDVAPGKKTRKRYYEIIGKASDAATILRRAHFLHFPRRLEGYLRERQGKAQKTQFMINPTSIRWVDWTQDPRPLSAQFEKGVSSIFSDNDDLFNDFEKDAQIDVEYKSTSEAPRAGDWQVEFTFKDFSRDPDHGGVDSIRITTFEDDFKLSLSFDFSAWTWAEAFRKNFAVNERWLQLHREKKEAEEAVERARLDKVFAAEKTRQTEKRRLFFERMGDFLSKADGTFVPSRDTQGRLIIANPPDLDPLDFIVSPHAGSGQRYRFRIPNAPEARPSAFIVAGKKYEIRGFSGFPRTIQFKSSGIQGSYELIRGSQDLPFGSFGHWLVELVLDDPASP